jgi:hypothetical protein
MALANVSSCKVHLRIDFFMVLGLELRAYTLQHSTSPFLWRVFFEIGSHGTVFLGLLLTMILLISASWAARVIDVSNQILAQNFYQSVYWSKVEDFAQIVLHPWHQLLLFGISTYCPIHVKYYLIIVLFCTSLMDSDLKFLSHN